MTKPNLDEKLLEKMLTDNGLGTSEFEKLAFRLGERAALEALRDVPGEFDLGAARKAWETIFNDAPEDEPPSAIALARWQFSRDKKRIAASEGAVQIAAEILTKKHAKFEKAQARIAEMTEAIVFSLRGLQMWRTYQSPGNIAEVEQRLRQALTGRDGRE